MGIPWAMPERKCFFIDVFPKVYIDHSESKKRRRYRKRRASVSNLCNSVGLFIV